ncbi:two component transcriptional regulator, LytTR family [Paenimyroides aquimaris]|uniref:Two component transcriptional regulator, LytTR family n=1 Tax=Paenimyroides marinum TaxID=1159016 RepID=A0A1H6M7M9_9FLAO|nr:LytTR family DNA-binding domain-containing protein [Paenimyroides aquimaris]SEH97381.1 two component transcriptional regulator, LytTR family [Paenimyroides aquimaris]
MVKNKLKCLIVDDEPMALSLLEKYVLQTPSFLELIGKCTNAFEALNYLSLHKKPDVIFLDIQMPELNGLEFSKTLPENIKIIFTTAFDQFALESYKVNALDYLLKPFDYSEFLTAANKAKNWLGLAKLNSISVVDKEYFFIKSEYKQIKINFNDILYIEGLKDYAKIFLVNQPKPILSLISLKKLEEELPSDRFMRIHRSFIIALNRVESVERSQVIIQNQRITIADQYKEIFDIFLKGKSLHVRE